MNQTAGELQIAARSEKVRLETMRANALSLRRFSLLPVIFLVSGCFGSGDGGSLADRYGTPKMPDQTEVFGTISLSGTGAGSTRAATVPVAAATTADIAANNASIAPQLEALTSEIKSLSERFAAMEPAINRLVRVEQDMTALIAEMELLANEPVPFVAPPELFGFGVKSPAGSSPLSTGGFAVGQGSANLQNSAMPNQTGGPAGNTGITLDNQNTPVLSLGLSGAVGNSANSGQESTGDGSDFVTIQPAPASQTLQPLNQPGQISQSSQSSDPARLAIIEAAPRSAAAAQQPSQPGRACDSFGIHVGSYLLQESIVFAREDIRERYASIMQGLRYAIEDIDLRDGRGLFHRLIAGPVVSYEQATVLCADMEAGGNYCKVTFFNPPECTAP